MNFLVPRNSGFVYEKSHEFEKKSRASQRGAWPDAGARRAPCLERTPIAALEAAPHAFGRRAPGQEGLGWMYQATGRYSSSTKFLVPADLVTPIPPRILTSAVSCQRGVRGKEEKTTPPLYTYSSICLIQGVADSTHFLRHEMTPWSSERPKRLHINSALNYFHEITLFLGVPYRAPPLRGPQGLGWQASAGLLSSGDRTL